MGIRVLFGHLTLTDWSKKLRYIALDGQRGRQQGDGLICE